MREISWLWLLPVLTLCGCAPFTPWFDYPADDPRLHFIGRMDYSTPEGPTYAFPGGTVRFRFRGTGVDVIFNDKSVGGDQHTNYVNILVDGENAAVVKLGHGSHYYKGARDLPPGEHVVEIVKRTESYAGTIQFLGVSLQGELLEPPPAPAKRLEVIGDSITCGYGNEVVIYAPNNTEPNTGYHSVNEDISKAYGTLIGRRLGMEVVTTCISGTGVYRNLNGKTDYTVPALYERVFPNELKPLWAYNHYIPDAIVINLGTNDFNVLDENKVPTEPPEAEFKAAYKQFVLRLRQLYPHALIVCSVGPLMNDNYPRGQNRWTHIKEWVSSMVEDVRTSTGDLDVHFFAYTPIGEPYGEDWHPTAKAHAQMAQEMSVFLHNLGI
jgi:lysophospholipase L1-like esterase